MTIHAEAMQEILFGTDSLAGALGTATRVMLVCGGSYRSLVVKDTVDAILARQTSGGVLTVFSSFGPNPLYVDVCRGVELFREQGIQCIVAVGGGSCIDTAKCIKLFGGMEPGVDYLTGAWSPAPVKLIAVPTTAGTGSESTPYAVIYHRGEKQSITHGGIIPDYAILDGEVLRTLSPYQRKCTMLDALCQGIESWWSLNSTPQSIGYSRLAVEGIMRGWRGYILGDDPSLYEGMMLGANYAGRAICITQTTAPHAFSYKVTSTYSFPHGHAVALCLPLIWEFMVGHMEKCIDPRGRDYLWGVFRDIASALGADGPSEGIEVFRGILSELGMGGPSSSTPDEDVAMLSAGVNLLRLGNNPVRLDLRDMEMVYSTLLGVRRGP